MHWGEPVNFMNCACFSDPAELKKCIHRIQELVLPLPRPIVVVARYIFAFLNQYVVYSGLFGNILSL